jgi:hypothetical protein
VTERISHQVVVIGGGNAGVSLAARRRRSGLTDIAIIEPACSARPHCTRCWPRRCAACSRSACRRSASHSSTFSARSRAEKNVARSSTLARVRRASSSWDAAAADRAARRASLVIALFPMFFTLKPVNPLRRNRTQQSCLPPTPRLCTRPLTNAPHRHLGNPNFLASPNITPSALRSRNGNARLLGRLTRLIFLSLAVA